MAHRFPNLPEVSHPAVEGAQKQNDLNLDEAIQVALKTKSKNIQNIPKHISCCYPVDGHTLGPCYDTVDGTNPVPVDAVNACVKIMNRKFMKLPNWCIICLKIAVH